MLCVLGNILGLKPLDRIQINSRAMIAESVVGVRLYGCKPGALPFYYFQRVLSDGRVEARSPGGTSIYVDVQDVCDIRPGRSVVVRAMPRSTFIRHGGFTPDSRPDPSDFCPAYVLWAAKNRWKQVEPRVLFLDDNLNLEPHNSAHFIAPIHPDDQPLLNKSTRRSVMPVCDYRTVSCSSADQGMAHEAQTAESVVHCFFRASLVGGQNQAARLATVGADPISARDLRAIRYRRAQS